MLGSNPYQQYKEQSLSTMAPGEILVKLYDETIKQMRIAELGIEKNDLGSLNKALNRAQAILATLEDSLNNDYEVSANLRNLYVFIAKQLLEANVKKDTSYIKECIPLVRELRDSFDQAEKLSRIQQRAIVGGKAV